MPSARPAALACLALLAGAAAGASASPAPWEHEARSTTGLRGPVTKVVVDLDVGSLVVHRGRAARVSSTSTWFMTKPSVSVSLRNGVLTVTGRCPSLVKGSVVKVGDPLGDCRTDVDVSLVALPRSVSARTGTGNVTVTGVRGPSTLSSGYGDVTARDLRGGAVRVAAEGGSADLMDVVAPGLQVSSVTGDTTLARVRSTRTVAVRAQSGDVSAVAVVAPAVQVAATGSAQLVDVRARTVSVRTDDGTAILNDSTVGTADLASSRAGAVVNAVSAASRLTVRADGAAAQLAQVRTPHLDVASGAGGVALATLEAFRTLTVSTAGGDVDLTVRGGRYALGLSSDGGAIALDGVVADARSASSITVQAGGGDIAVHGR